MPVLHNYRITAQVVIDIRANTYSQAVAASEHMLDLHPDVRSSDVPYSTGVEITSIHVDRED